MEDFQASYAALQRELDASRAPSAEEIQRQQQQQ
jgi:hypothetical protein